MPIFKKYKGVLPRTNKCEFCGTKSKTTKKYILHASNCVRKQFRKKYNKNTQVFQCKFCPKSFSAHYYLDHHIVEKHQCWYCNKKYADPTDHILQHPQIGKALSTGKISRVIKLYKKRSAFRGFISTYQHNTKKKYDLVQYFHLIKNSTRCVLLDAFKRHNIIKAQLTLFVKFKRRILTNYNGKSVYEFQKKLIHGYMILLTNRRRIENFYKRSCSKIESTVNIFQEYGSGWIFDRVLGSNMNTGKYNPIRGGCSFEIPEEIKSSRSVINVKSGKNECFKFAFLASIHFKEIQMNRNRASKYIKFEHLYDFSGIKYPMSIRKIPSFEDKNNVAVNVFGWENGIIPLYISENNYSELQTVNLLMLNNEGRSLYHYLAITDVNSLLGGHNHHAKLVCYYCLCRIVRCKSYCGNAECDEQCKLKDHLENCKKFKFQKVKLPKSKDGKLPQLKFTNFGNQIKAGYVIYSDLEALIIEKCEGTEIEDTEFFGRDVETSKIHHVCGFSYVVVKSDSSIVSHRVYRGENAVEIFFSDLTEIVDSIVRIYEINVKLKMTPDEDMAFETATICHICRQVFSDEDIVVRDHDHLSSKYRGAAHQSCNLNYQQKQKVPIVMHNLRGYDSHLLIPGFEKFGETIQVIPTNTEKFMSIIVDNMYFIDSLQFLNTALSDLVSELKNDEFYLLEEVFGHELSKLLKRKGVYPYDYMNSWDKFEESELPAKDKFFNTLRNEHISDDDYKYAHEIFKKFEMTSLGDYHDVYLLTDTLLLASVFESFRKLSLNNYGLDPVYYMSAPGLSFDSALKMTKKELELLTDIDKYEFLEAGIRGGISQIGLRKADANNKYMKTYKGTGNEQNQKYIMYWDMNNLYGKALAGKLPTKNFRWLNEFELKTFNINNIPENSDIGFIISCDLEYPLETHDLHSDFPVAVEKKSVPLSEFGQYQTKLLQKLEIKYMENQEKLIAHLGDREKYITYYENLKFYTRMGLKIKKIHKVLEFKQENWLKPYILFNTQKRIHATSEFEKNFYKLLNNSIFGKTMENVRKRVSVELVKSAQRAGKLLQKPTYKTHYIFSENLAMFSMEKSIVQLNKAIYTGFVVLETSKLYIAEFHYDFIKKIYGKNAILLMTDTDSLAYIIVTRDVYEDMLKYSHLFDTSDYPVEHPNYSLENKKIIGKMKDEAKGNILCKFLGLGPKSYCFLGSKLDKNESFEKKAMKGVPKFIQRKSVTFDTFNQILEDQKLLVCNFNQIRSFQHRVFSVKTSKAATHGFDSKRYICED